MTINLTPVEMLAGLGVLLVVVAVWRASVRAARRAADVARAGVRLMSLAGRVGFTAGVIVAAQWIIMTQPTSTALRGVVLGMPALLAAHTLTKALTVTTLDAPHRRGGRR